MNNLIIVFMGIAFIVSISYLLYNVYCYKKSVNKYEIQLLKYCIFIGMMWVILISILYIFFTISFVKL
jgi:hypothetical protein